MHKQSNIEVIVRIRPTIDRERGTDQITSVSADGSSINLKHGDSTFSCEFDSVLDWSTSQSEVFEKVSDIVSNSVQGFNSTLFAYGQTGSGKTFTLVGPDVDGSLSDVTAKHIPPSSGILPRVVIALFDQLRVKRRASKDYEASLYLSIVHIYNEQLFDLLHDSDMKHPLSVRENRQEGVFIEGVSEFALTGADDAISLFRQAHGSRAVRATHMNALSSRSHTLFQFTLEQRAGGEGARVTRSKLNIVDLAGSEKWNMALEMEGAHITELKRINLSLHTLGRVITALSSQTRRSTTTTIGLAGHVPYRDSLLTRLLQDSLGGNTRTKLIATISPSFLNANESISTLKFADCARQVMNVARVNHEREVDKVLVTRLEDQVKALSAQIVELSAEVGHWRSMAQRGSESVNAIEVHRLGPAPASLASLADSAVLTPIARPSGEVDKTVASLRAHNASLWTSLQAFMNVTQRFFNLEVEEDVMQAEIKRITRGLPKPPRETPLTIESADSRTLPPPSPVVSELPSFRSSISAADRLCGSLPAPLASASNSISYRSEGSEASRSSACSTRLPVICDSASSRSRAGDHAAQRSRDLHGTGAATGLSGGGPMLFRVRDKVGASELRKTEDESEKLETELKSLYKRMDKHRRVAEFAALRKMKEEAASIAAQEVRQLEIEAAVEKQRKWEEKTRRQKLKIANYYSSLSDSTAGLSTS